MWSSETSVTNMSWFYLLFSKMIFLQGYRLLVYNRSREFQTLGGGDKTKNSKIVSKINLSVL